MAVYPLIKSPTFYAEIKSAITTDTYLSIVYDDGSSAIIAYHSGLEIYMDFEALNAGMPILKLGLSWVSGASLVDSFDSITNAGLVNVEKGWLISFEDFILICFQPSSGESYMSTNIIAKNNLNELICLGLRGDSTWVGANSKNFDTANTTLNILPLSAGVVNVDGNYGQIPLYLVSTNGVLYPIVTLPKLKIMLRPAILANSVVGDGTNLLINAKYSGSTALNISVITLLGEGLYV